MKSAYLRIAVLSACLFLLFSGRALSQSQDSTRIKEFETAEGVVSEIYKTVTFEPGQTPDWEKVRSMFLDNAVVVLRTSREGSTVFSVPGFIDDFVNFIEKSPAKQAGFSEKIIRMKPLIFGDIAHILVLYEVHIPGTPRPPQQGVDSFQLVKKNGRWWIIAIANEIPGPNRPLPTELQE